VVVEGHQRDNQCGVLTHLTRPGRALATSVIRYGAGYQHVMTEHIPPVSSKQIHHVHHAFPYQLILSVYEVDNSCAHGTVQYAEGRTQGINVQPTPL
jgi:hypothetical protein